MDWNDLEPQKKKPAPKDLSVMGVAELEEYIAELQAEIDRAKAVIADKQKHRSGVEGLFKS